MNEILKVQQDRINHIANSFMENIFNKDKEELLSIYEDFKKRYPESDYSR